MCAEVLWWRCHRRLIAGALVSLGVEVVHARSETQSEPHRIAPPAAVTAHGLSYPAADEGP